jgi:hypothetical protein
MMKQDQVGTLCQHYDPVIPHGPNILLVDYGSSLPDDCLVY